MSILAAAIQQESRSLSGASVAVSERGTLLLNPQAWLLFAPSLKQIPDLALQHAGTEDTKKPLRFVLIGS
jgi:hypothetical protein